MDPRERQSLVDNDDEQASFLARRISDFMSAGFDGNLPSADLEGEAKDPRTKPGTRDLIAGVFAIPGLGEFLFVRGALDSQEAYQGILRYHEGDLKPIKRQKHNQSVEERLSVAAERGKIPWIVLLIQDGETRSARLFHSPRVSAARALEALRTIIIKGRQ